MNDRKCKRKKHTHKKRMRQETGACAHQSSANQIKYSTLFRSRLRDDNLISCLNVTSETLSMNTHRMDKDINDARPKTIGLWSSKRQRKKNKSKGKTMNGARQTSEMWKINVCMAQVVATAATTKFLMSTQNGKEIQIAKKSRLFIDWRASVVERLTGASHTKHNFQQVKHFSLNSKWVWVFFLIPSLSSSIFLRRSGRPCSESSNACSQKNNWIY